MGESDGRQPGGALFSGKETGEEEQVTANGQGTSEASSSSKAKMRPAPPHGSFRYYQLKLWTLLDEPGSSVLAQVWSTFMMMIILLSIGSFTIASAPEDRHFVDVWVNATTDEVIEGSKVSPQPPNSYRSFGHRPVQSPLDENRTPFGEIETFCIMVFTVEYILRLFTSPAGPGVLKYLINLANIVDFISIIPWYIERSLPGGSPQVLSVLRLIRLTRITRIFKMSKSFQGIIMLLTTLRKSATALLMLFAFMGVFSLLFATLIYTFEMGEYDEIRKQYVRPDGSRSPYESIPTSMWWTIVTMTTVGYGDQFPVTELGKLVAVFTMFSGLIVLSLPITIIGANFDSEYREFKKAKQEELERKRRARRAQEEAAEAARRAAEQLSPDGPKKRLSGLGSLLLTTAPSTPKKEGASAQPPTPGSVAAKKEEAEKKDPIKIIQTIIHESNYQLLAEIDELLERHENKLRAQVKDVLRRHAAGIDERPTPLDPKIIVPKGT